MAGRARDEGRGNDGSEPKYFSLREAVPSSLDSSGGQRIHSDDPEGRETVINSDERNPQPLAEPVEDDTSSSDEEHPAEEGVINHTEKHLVHVVSDSSRHDKPEVIVSVPDPVPSPLGHGPCLEAFSMEAAQTGRVSPSLPNALGDVVKSEKGASFADPLLKPWQSNRPFVLRPYDIEVRGGMGGNVNRGGNVIGTPASLRERTFTGASSSSEESISGHRLSGPAIKKQWEEAMRKPETPLRLRGSGLESHGGMLLDAYSPAGSRTRTLAAMPLGFSEGMTRPARSGSCNVGPGGTSSVLSTHLRTYLWAPDEDTVECMGACGRAFTPWVRRHHCRCCGGIFCQECSKQRCLIPDPVVPPDRKMLNPTHPYRVCSSCYLDLEPSQEELIARVCNARRPNVFYPNSPMRHCNPPLAMDLAHEIRKAANTLNNILPSSGECHPNLTILDRQAATDILKTAKALVFVTVAKAGFLYAVEGGTGLCVSRLGDNTWSAPSAIAVIGMSWGLQAGCQFVDLIVPLLSNTAVEMLKRGEQLAVELELGLTVGPLGRSGLYGISGRVWPGEGPRLARVSSYSLSKGLFLGMGIGVSMVLVRDGVNERFYGTQVSPRSLLSGLVARPSSAEPLYTSLARLDRFMET